MGDDEGSSSPSENSSNDTDAAESSRPLVGGLLSWLRPGTTEDDDTDQIGDRDPSRVGMSNLRRMRVEDVAVPVAEIAACDIGTSREELIEVFRESGFTRLPVYEGTLDSPLGMVHLKDMALKFGFNGHGEEFDLQALIRPVLYVPPSMPIGVLLQKMQSQRLHMALVIDEYGGTDGLVTIEDLVEEIVGEINDEHDDDDTLVITPISGGGWEVDARVELTDFTEETGLHLDTEDDEIDTIGGYAVSLAGRVPQRGEVLSGLNGYDFEVIEGDARKVRRLRVRPSAAKSSTQAAE